MSDLTINASPFAFEARWEREDAPKTVSYTHLTLPTTSRV